MKAEKDPFWSYTVGMLPHRVVAYEDPARKGVTYLRWRVAGDWRRKSLGYSVRNDKGKVDRAKETQAQHAADEQYARLVSGGAVPTAPAAELTIADGWTIATDPERGYWTQDTAHRREMARAVERAKSVWGARTAWNAIDRGEVRRLWRAELKRQRAKGNDGVRASEIVVARLMALAGWLRDEGKILPTACAPWKLMKEELRKDCGDYAPKRLRYSADEFRALLAASEAVDPRWHLLLTLGAEYRLGQVVRTHRSHLQREPAQLTIPGKGKKRGVTIRLTSGQRAVLEAALTTGYLAGLEAAYASGAVADYPLFPGRKLPRRDGQVVTMAKHATREPLDSYPLRTWLRETEGVARVNGKPIAHVEGRGWYGLRRAAVDAAKAAGISREGLQQHGGWSDAQIPDRIYADQEAQYARDEAASIRAKIRGETEQNGAQTINGSPSGEPKEPSK